MIFTVIGMRALNFTSNDGHQIVGTTLFVSFDDDSESVIGEKTDKLFVKDSIALPSNLKPGDAVNISFTQKGKVEKVSLAK